MQYTPLKVTRGLSITKTVTGASPVTLSEVKDYLLLGDNTTHDDLITRLIIAGTKAVEKYCNISLMAVSCTVRYEEAGRVELPYGPIQEVLSVEDKDGGEITDYTQEGLVGGFITLDLERDEPTVITYTAGYTDTPEDLKLSIIKWVTDNFEARTGFDMAGKATVQMLPTHWKLLANSYRRIVWWG